MPTIFHYSPACPWEVEPFPEIPPGVAITAPRVRFEEGVTWLLGEVPPPLPRARANPPEDTQNPPKCQNFPSSAVCQNFWRLWPCFFAQTVPKMAFLVNLGGKNLSLGAMPLFRRDVPSVTGWGPHPPPVQKSNPGRPAWIMLARCPAADVPVVRQRRVEEQLLLQQRQQELLLRQQRQQELLLRQQERQRAAEAAAQYAAAGLDAPLPRRQAADGADDRPGLGRDVGCAFDVGHGESAGGGGSQPTAISQHCTPPSYR